MISNKKDVQALAALMIEKGITDVVISPGSRNAPLINTFAALPAFRCFNVVDERSAAFFAMGLALRLARPVALACTSGSAVLNYAPAVAEAFYQKIPLIILSADRPREWIDQGEGQSIRQEEVLKNIVKKSVSLSGGMRDDDEVWYNVRLINEALNAASDVENAPVHINLPFTEPLYAAAKGDLPQVKNITINRGKAQLDEAAFKTLKREWQQADKKMILVGQMQPDEHLEALLNKMSQNDSLVILAEKTSNLKGDKILTSIDNLLFACDDEDLQPDLLITLGGQLVSKKVKAFLRRHKAFKHWHFSASAEVRDTFRALSRLISVSPLEVLSALPLAQNGTYAKPWHTLDRQTAKRHKHFLKTCDFCDFSVFNAVMKHLPENSVLHLANSTPVRYAQLFPMKRLVYQSNRGVSGIDGVVSTAAGYAHDDERLNVLLVGDLSFFYDSNALWNKHFPKNLKIILINNEGGGIFRFMEGPSQMPSLEEHFAAVHQTRAQGLAESYGLTYGYAADFDSLERGVQQLLTSPKASVLEVSTPPEKNAKVLRAYIDFLKNSIIELPGGLG